MPNYDYSCERCAAEWEEAHAMAACADVHPCPMCRGVCTQRIMRVTAIRGAPDSGWEYENGGRGRRISQLAKDPHDMTCCYRTQSEAADAAKARGYLVEKP